MHNEDARTLPAAAKEEKRKHAVNDHGSEGESEVQAVSPELNPNEYLNCDLKHGIHSGKPA
jgi:hypothetical protein